MALFLLGGLLLLLALGWPVLAWRITKMMAEESTARKFEAPVMLRSPFVIGTSVFVGLIGFAFGLTSTAIYVKDNCGGVVIVKFGSDLPPGRIVATSGEKGPQGYILPPGWHFGYMPWLYDLESVNNVIIPAGKVGVVSAMDGKSMPDGQIYADEWADRNQMLDAQVFLTTTGTKGPQLTVLTPGQYRYNPRLFTIETRDALVIKVGEVAVIKANAGPAYHSAAGEEVFTVNGTPIVPIKYRGIWKEALTPNSYYIHPDAYEVIRVQTTNRVYNYVSHPHGESTNQSRTEDSSIRVRTKDGFMFPVDIRVSIKISAESAAQVVAQLANPDAEVPNSQYCLIEHRVVLPLIRAIFRNAAEKKAALEFVTQRSIIEKEASEEFKKELEKFHITTDGVFIADVGLDETEQGKKLLQTQTDREVAAQQQITYSKQQEAEMKRAEMERERSNADQEKPKAESLARIQIADNDAKAKLKTAEAQAKSFQMQAEAEANGAKLKAEADAAGYKAKVEAIGGVQNFVTLETLRAFAAQWKGTFPETMILGGNGDGVQQALMLKWLQQMNQENKKPEEEKK